MEISQITAKNCPFSSDNPRLTQLQHHSIMYFFNTSYRQPLMNITL